MQSMEELFSSSMNLINVKVSPLQDFLYNWFFSIRLSVFTSWLYDIVEFLMLLI